VQLILVLNLGMQLQPQGRKHTSNHVVARSKVCFGDMEVFLSSLLVGVIFLLLLLMVLSYFPTFSPSPCPPPTVFPTVVSLTAPSASPSLPGTAIAPVVSTSSPSAATTEAPSIAPTDYAISDFKSSVAEVFSHLAHPTPPVLGGMIAAGLALLCLALYGIRYFYFRGASSDKEVVKTSSLDGIEFIVDDSLELGSGGGSATSSLSRNHDGEKFLPGSFRYDEQLNHPSPSAQVIAVYGINTDASSVGSENV
jgi:hypothetical protein